MSPLRLKTSNLQLYKHFICKRNRLRKNYHYYLDWIQSEYFIIQPITIWSLLHNNYLFSSKKKKNMAEE